MNNYVDWPFSNCQQQVTGMKLPEYLEWANGGCDCKKKLYLPPIQRGFVWKPKQIVDLWDSLLRGMPIGCLMVNKLSKEDKALDLINREIGNLESDAIGLIDGQQRTLAMLLCWPNTESDQHCLWIDLGEDGPAGSPFELRFTTKTQPFGFQRFWHGKLTLNDRKKAREQYDKIHPENKDKRDHELFNLEKPYPWKGGKNSAFLVPFKNAWEIFRNDRNRDKFISHFKYLFGTNDVNKKRLTSLHHALERLENLEVPLVLIPEHISRPQYEYNKLSKYDDAPAPLIVLFERIGQNGARLSPDDLLFSMIKQQWPEAHELVEKHRMSKVGYLMNSTDYVATAYRLAAAEINDTSSIKIADNPRPNPNDFHRHLDKLLGKNDDNHLPLRKYLKERTLVSAFESLYAILAYSGNKDIGLPDYMLPHLSRGLIQVLLRWIMLNKPDQNTIEANRNEIIAFTLFWYLCIWNEDKSSKASFALIDKGSFPAKELYKTLCYAQTENDIGMALPLISPERLKAILVIDELPLLRSGEEIFCIAPDNKPIASVQERELYKRFCWWRKPLLLWFQRKYVQREFCNSFAGLTDEDAVPYDYDHLCPQNHWGADWRNIKRLLPPRYENAFRANRSHVGNCIGNLHILESSLNRSLGDAPLETKLESTFWNHDDSQLYHDPIEEHENLWKLASPEVEKEKHKIWNEKRLNSFQDAVYRRAFGLYKQLYTTCCFIIPES